MFVYMTGFVQVGNIGAIDGQAPLINPSHLAVAMVAGNALEAFLKRC